MSALSDYEVTGAAAPGSVRAAALIDLLAATIVSMLAYPQPAVRAAISGAGLPIWVFVLSLLAVALVVFALYEFACAMIWGRSPGMYLMDVGLHPAGRLGAARAALWALGWLVAVLPALLGMAAAYGGDTGLPARFSGVSSRSTAAR